VSFHASRCRQRHRMRDEAVPPFLPSGRRSTLRTRLVSLRGIDGRDALRVLGRTAGRTPHALRLDRKDRRVIAHA
jgi:hypothetical protein